MYEQRILELVNSIRPNNEWNEGVETAILDLAQDMSDHGMDDETIKRMLAAMWSAIAEESKSD